MAHENGIQLIHLPWWGWLLLLAIFETCSILTFIGLFGWGVPLPG